MATPEIYPYTQILEFFEIKYEFFWPPTSSISVSRIWSIVEFSQFRNKRNTFTSFTLNCNQHRSLNISLVHSSRKRGVRLSVQRDAGAGSSLSENGKVRELLHLHLAVHRRSVKAPVHRSITWQRGMDNVALWSVTPAACWLHELYSSAFHCSIAESTSHFCSPFR